MTDPGPAAPAAAMPGHEIYLKLAAWAGSVGITLSGLFGWWYAVNQQLPIWHGMYCAIGNAVTAGGDCQPHGFGYAIVTMEFYSIVPLYAIAVGLFISWLGARVILPHVRAAHRIAADLYLHHTGNHHPAAPAAPAAAQPPPARGRRTMPNLNLKLYPAAILYAVNAVVAVIISTGVVSATAGHYITTIASAVLGLVVAFSTRPVVASTVAALFTTLITAMGGFGLHLSPTLTGLLTTAVSMLAAYLTHLSVSPVAAGRHGTALAAEAASAR